MRIDKIKYYAVFTVKALLICVFILWRFNYFDAPTPELTLPSKPGLLTYPSVPPELGRVEPPSATALIDEQRKNIAFDVEPFGQLLRYIRQAVDLQNSTPPTMNESWRHLKLGEFEEQSVYEERVKSAKAKATSIFNRDAKAWNTRIEYLSDKITESHNALQPPTLVSLDGYRHAPSKLQMAYASIGQDMLPRFNRASMSFDNVEFIPQIISKEIFLRGDSTNRCVFTYLRRPLKITSDNFSTAKEFKEMAANNDIRFIVDYQPILFGFESPIVLVEARTEEEIDKTRAGLGILALFLTAAFAEDPMHTLAQNDALLAESILGSVTATSTVEHPAQTTPGVRTKVRLWPVRFVAINADSGIPLTGVAVAPIDSSPEVRIERVDTTHQKGDEALQPGDAILEVAGTRVLSQDHFLQLIKLQPSGQVYEIVYRTALDDKIKRLAVIGGRPIGIKHIQVYP